MGAGASVSEAKELAAFQAVREAYSKMDPSVDEVQAFEQLREVYLAQLGQPSPPQAAATPPPPSSSIAPAGPAQPAPVTGAGEGGTAPLHPLVVEAMRMSEEEKEALAAKVLEAAVEEDKRKGGGAAARAAAKKDDYSKSFAGTEQDSRVEKEFEAMIRGTDAGTTDSGTHPLLAPCPAEAYQGLRQAGRWRRYLSVTGCYCYVHSMTHELVAVKPDDYVEEGAGQGGGEAVDPAHGLASCQLSEVPRVLEQVVDEEHKTPLFLDTSPERKLSSFFSYKSIHLDVSALAVGYAKTGLKTTELIERARQKTVSALKAGQLLVLDLGAVTSAHGNFKAKLCKRDAFPLEIFQEGGAKLFGPNIGPRYEKLFRDEDKEQGQCMVRKDGFRFAVVSSLGPTEYEAALSESLPLGYMKPIYVHSSPS